MAKKPKETEHQDFNEFVECLTNLELIVKHCGRLQGLVGIELEDITFLPYETLKNIIPDLVKRLKFEEVIFEVLKAKDKAITMEKIVSQSNYDKFRFFVWVQDQYDAISELETKYLTLPPNTALANAGIKELDILGDINLIDVLAGGDILKWEAIRLLPYSTIFDKQLRITILEKIDRKRQEQKNQ